MSDVAHAEDVNETKEPQEAPQEDRSTELEARRLGWVNKDEFRGDPDKWRPADEFLDRGRRILPIVQANERRLHRRVDELEKLIKEQTEASKELLEFTSKSEQRAYERAKSEIMQRVEQGAANADASAVRAGMQELDALNKEHVPAPKKKDEAKASPQIDPVIQDWIDKEQWFLRDKALNAYATSVYEDVQREKPGLSEADRLGEVKKRTVDKFPEKFGVNPNREAAAAVATPSGTGNSRKSARTYDALPVEAKRACDKFVKSIPGYKREQYVADYDWES